MGHFHVLIAFSIIFLSSNSLMASKLTGTVTFNGISTIDQNSVANIKIIDSSRADAPSKTIGILFLNFNIK